MTTEFANPQALLGAVGADLGTTDWVTITQDQINKFAEATLDNQWIHVDTERAKAGPFGGPIAHGYLTLSLGPHLMGQVLHVDGIKMGVNYGLNKVRFPAPVPVGAKLRVGAALVEVEDIPGGAQITMDMTFEVEGQAKPSCVAQGVFRYYF